MKKLNISWDGVADSTGYLFSFAKSLACAVQNSPYSELSADIVATSGFAFRMWANADLCPSAMSIWAFSQQKPWVENGGLQCGYIERLWEQDDVAEARRLDAIEMIKASIDSGIAAISWEVGVPEWGLITGYDDEMQTFATLCVNGAQGEMPYDTLGNGDIPLLNVLTIHGRTAKPQTDVLADTLKMAKNHLLGGEWTDNAKGLAVYSVMTKACESDDPQLCLAWEMEYYLGTYAALKEYAWKYLEKCGHSKLAVLYKQIFECWQAGFALRTAKDMSDSANRAELAALLHEAERCEREAVTQM